MVFFKMLRRLFCLSFLLLCLSLLSCNDEEFIEANKVLAELSEYSSDNSDNSDNSDDSDSFNSSPSQKSFVSYNVKNGRVIEVDPEDLYIDTIGLEKSDIEGDFLNGTFFNWDGTTGEVLISSGKVINERDAWAVDNRPIGHFAVFSNGSIVAGNMGGFNSDEMKNITFGISGLNLFSDKDIVEEMLSSRKTSAEGYQYKQYRSAIGYNPSIDKVLLFVFTSPTTMYEMTEILSGLNCTKGIGLDGGGSTAGRFNGVFYNPRKEKRKIYNVIRWN